MTAKAKSNSHLQVGIRPPMIMYEVTFELSKMIERLVS
jgi:hypothetical protein